MRRCAVVALTLILTSLSVSAAATRGGPIPVPLPLFPPNNWWNTDISAAPVDGSSATFITFIGPTTGLHPDFGGDYNGGIIGMPYILVDGAQAKKTVTFVEYGEQSDGVNHQTGQPFPFYPIPDEAIATQGWVEGGPPANQNPGGDRHMLVVDTTNNTLYELYHVRYNTSLSRWQAGSGAFFDMNTNNRRPDTWTSADAAGLAILPGLVRYEEAFGAGEIRHAFRMTVDFTNGYVYPASHSAGSTAGALPMGARLRLKASKNISSFTPEMQRIFRAFKKYGLIVADNGSDMYIGGTYDTRWDNDVLNPAFAALKASDFDVIQRGWAPSVNFVIALPNTMGAGEAVGATVTAYDSNYNVATGYRGTIHFTSSDGAATLPVDYTFTSGDSGVHTFQGGFTLRTGGSQIVTATDVAAPTITGWKGVAVGPAAPTGLVATAATTTRVDLTWNPSPGAAQYEIRRASSANPAYGFLATTSASPYPDSSVVGGLTYVYKVKAIDSSSNASPLSAPDAATTIFFNEDPLAPNVTAIKAIHLTQLRQAVNTMRGAAGLTVASFTDPVLSTSILVKAAHVQELRAALIEARAALGVTALAFNPSLVVGSTKAAAAHVQELRNAVK